MTPIKSQKETQLAALTYLRIFEQQEADQVEGTYLPVDSAFLYKKQQRVLAYCLAMTSLSLFVFFYVLIIESNYYAQVDVLVVACFFFWLCLVAFSAWLFKQYLVGSRHLQIVFKTPNKSAFGVLITEEYYFERLPDHYHIIPKANIIRIDYEEKRNKGEVYLELLLDLGEHYEIRGLVYNPEEYDIKAWINQPIPTPTSLPVS